MAKYGNYVFTEKTILLTGASGGLGSSMARTLSKEGARLILSSRSPAALEELIASLAHPEYARAVPADLAVPGAGARLALEAERVWGGVDVLFNNAGLGYFATLDEASEELIRRLFEVNTFAPLSIIKSLLPGMIRRGGGRVINIVSCAGRVPIPTNAVYGGSKSALAVMANTMRLELEGRGIDVVNVYPGTVDTSFEENAFREQGRDRLCPMEHCGAPREEIAGKIIEAARGPAGEVFLDRKGWWMSVKSLVLPKTVDRRMAPLLRRVEEFRLRGKPPQRRRWRLWQIESSIACNLSCVMCPWEEYRKNAPGKGMMSPEVWSALKPYLPEVASVDLSGGGEALMNPHLPQWVADAKAAGCETGLLTNGTLLDAEKAGALVGAGIDWIAVSVDGATAEVFENVRRGASFEWVTGNIRRLAALKREGSPRIIVNFVMMPVNVHQLEDLVDLCAGMGVDRINFKQCDVIRGDSGKGFGLFGSGQTRQIRNYQKLTEKARKRAHRMGLEMEVFNFVPEEQPVCDQDPRDALFVRFDGLVSPCVSLAYGGPTEWLGREETMPSVHYGKLPGDGIEKLWETEACRRYRTRFEEREAAYGKSLASSRFEPSLQNLHKALDEARLAMPPALEGCRVCHYLYGI